MPPTLNPVVLTLSASDLDELLDASALIEAVEQAFRARGDGAVHPGGVIGVELAHGGFHVKAAALEAARGVFAVKLNGNFPANPSVNGLPTIQGLMIVADVANGTPLAVMDSGAVTRLRTAAASAVAIRHLARADADALTMVGCGAQAFDQVRFAHLERPLRRLDLVDARPEAAERLAERVRRDLGVAVVVSTDLRASCARSSIVITCTTVTMPILFDCDVTAGTLVVAVGADNPRKNEIDPQLLANAKVVTDVTVQCAAIGDLHHAIEAGAMRLEDVHAELGEVIAGARAGRESARERIIFDGTGTPIQDAAAAQLALTRAAGPDVGACFDFRA